jgi:hypothetical protein
MDRRRYNYSLILSSTGIFFSSFDFFAPVRGAALFRTVNHKNRNERKGVFLPVVAFAPPLAAYFLLRRFF